MALKYNGTSPTAIKYNGTDLTVLKYGTTAVWGKPYSLSISAGSNTSVTVTRTSSPNQHASTGTLSSGSVIYYGDVLTISYSVSSGYKINTATVNGTAFTSGQSFTVTSAISVVTTAVASASLHTVWTGQHEEGYNSFDDDEDIHTKTILPVNGIRANVPTRITGSFMWYEWNFEERYSIQFSKLQNGYYYYQNTLDTNGDERDFSIGQTNNPTYPYCFWGVSSVNTNCLTITYRKMYSSFDYSIFYRSPALKITKLEQYY